MADTSTLGSTTQEVAKTTTAAPAELPSGFSPPDGELHKNIPADVGAPAPCVTGGTAQFDLLLKKPPGEVAAWTLAQMQDLGQADNLVESLEIFKVASAFGNAPIEEKEALISSVMQGVGDLPREQRADALRLFSQLPTSTSAMMEQASSSASSNAQAASMHVLSTNLARVAKESAISEMAPDELKSLSQVVEKEQGQLVQPLLDAVSELSEDDRRKITESLVEKGVVTEENRSVLEDTIKPGGHADKVATVLQWLSFAHRHTWLVWGLPMFEIVLAVAIAGSVCKVPLLPWLISDAVLGVGMACSAYFIKHLLKSTYQEFSDNPLGTASRVQASMAEGAKLIDVIPGAGCAMYFVVAIVLLVVLGALLVIMGIIQLLETVYSPCPAAQRLTAIIVSIPIMLLRVMLPVVVCILVIKAVRKIQELKGPEQGSEPLVTEPEVNYGAVAGQV